MPPRPSSARVIRDRCGWLLASSSLSEAEGQIVCLLDAAGLPSDAQSFLNGS